jgi:bla regulator protein BlaR1
VNSSVLIAIANHLWQSTLFAAVAGFLTLFLRNNSARVRWSVWLAASLKFLIPFAILTDVGSRIPRPSGSIQVTAPGIFAYTSQTAARVLQFGGERVTALVHDSQPLNYGAVVLISLGLAWGVGTLAVAVRWFSRWRALRRALRESTASSLPFAIPVRSSSSQFEPAVVGILRPVLLLPQGMEDHLTAAEMDAVLAHERCHVAWRDNLTASVHMFVEALFWFHPLVWWLGARLIDERERACDERVLAQGHPSYSYAEGILKICERCLQSPLTNAAGVSGANLSQRIEAIMKNRLVERLGSLRKLALAVAAGATIAIPLSVGMLASSRGNAEAATAGGNVPALRNVQIALAPVPLPSLQPPGLFNPFGQMLQDGNRVQGVYALRDVIAAAYGVETSQVVGIDLSKEPVYLVTADNPWPDSPPTATGEERASTFRRSLSEIPAIERNTLSRYFGLVVKRERRQMPGYVLTVGPGGSKLDQDTDAPYWKEGMGLSEREIIATKATVGLIVRLLDGMFRAPVVDQTGLKGTYDYKLTWPPSSSGAMPEPATMAKALEEQLGLRLEAKTVAVDVIDVVSLKSTAQIVSSN